MKRIISCLILAFALLCGAKAQEAAYYGLSTNGQPDPEGISALGSGKSSYVAALVALDPATDPVMQRLKGQQILGVRCFLRAAYKQKSQKRSYVMLCEDSPENMTSQQYTNFEAGWNDVYFDEPYTIGDGKIFIGMQVYETTGTPYPAVTQSGISVPGGCYTNVGRSGWNEFSDRGVLLIQAILAPETAPLLERSAYVKATDCPLLVEPSQKFNCKLYVHNLSAQPLASAQIATIGTGDEGPRLETVEFTTPIAPYEARLVPAQVYAGSAEGSSQDLTLQLTEFNGESAQPAQPGVCQLFVTLDAFTRIPLIEEFTGQTCSNCPFMSYYVDIAIEEYEKPVLYVAHHAGFQDDALTQPVDKELIYLFGPEYGPDYKYAYNPAIMYDRTVLKGETLPVYGAKLPSHEPYLAAIREAAATPAMAQVLVDAEQGEDGTLSVRSYGRIHRDLVDSEEPLYISTYIVENGLSVDDYFQLGLDADDAPDDLLQRFRHNGVIRHNLCTTLTGDRLQAEADATFSVSYDPVVLSPTWKWENCQVISFVHRIDKNDLTKNAILNAGSNKLNGHVSGIATAPTQATASVRAYADASRRIRTSRPVESMELYDLRGCRLDPQAAQPQGIYVVRLTTAGGDTSTQKVIVR